MEIMKQIQTWTDSLCGTAVPSYANRPVSARAEISAHTPRLRGNGVGFPKHNPTPDSAPGAHPA
ncbi:hypothetical protein [Myceligenerans crystallogenes]|uniref:Uncharacterized protein n=1 Tax=Myceligenerans crystallogenes TaxID=316335 RepID=A0ABN2N4B4_9MICO